MRRPGATPSPVAVGSGRVEVLNVTSPIVGGLPQKVFVYLPPGYGAQPDRRYPVIYFLHGVPGAPQGFLDIGRVNVLEDLLVAEGRMRPAILVMPMAAPGALSDTEWANGIGRHSAWETYLAGVLVRAIDARYRTIRAPAGRALVGLSEGGYGALNVGLHHLNEFRVLESWSGYMRAENLPQIFGRRPARLIANSPVDEVRRLAGTIRRDHVYVWFYCGARDALRGQNRAFAAELAGLGIRHRFFIVPGLGHNWRLWRTEMVPALLAASSHLADG